MKDRVLLVVALVLFWSGVAGAIEVSHEPILLTAPNWKVLSYSKIPPNRVEFEEGKMKVTVDKSAGPVVSKLKEPKRIAGFKISGSWKGSKKKEASDFDEDSVLRVGLVVEGKRTMSWLQKLVAANWVKELFSLSTEGQGIDRILFFNTTNRKELLGKSRTHPQSDLLVEKVQSFLDQEGSFEMNVNLDEPLKVLGLWLSLDGDQTQSAYVATIEQFQISEIKGQ